MPRLTAHFLTIFPEAVKNYLSVGVLARGEKKGEIRTVIHDLRDFAPDRWRKVDDRPFGGGAGMVLKPEPIFLAVEKIRETAPGAEVFFFTPGGEFLTQKLAQSLANEIEKPAETPADKSSPDRTIILLSGRYEGIDQRVRDALVDREICLGPFVLAGGELAALAFFEAVARLLPGVLGNEESPLHESFSGDLENALEWPHFTQPADFRGMKIPEILRSGDHGKIEKWRRSRARPADKK